MTNDLPRVHCRTNPAWLREALESLRDVGCAIVEGVLDAEHIRKIREHMYAMAPLIVKEVGAARLQAAQELGVLRLMMKYDPYFLTLLQIPEMLDIVDKTVSETAILHLQNGFILPPMQAQATDEVFQLRFHRDFPRAMNGYMASINVFLALDDYTEANGGTRAILGTHQKEEAPDAAYMKKQAVTLACAAGDLIVFDSTLWHAAGRNSSSQDRLGINHQFTRSFIKQQIDYVRALGDDRVRKEPPRSQQLLGYYTRVVTSLDDYYRPEADRLYRKGQG